MRSPLLCDAERSQLVLIDIQGRLAAAMPDEARAQVLRSGAILSRGAQLLSIPVIATEQYPKGLGPTDPAIAEALPPHAPVMEKSCFACTGSATFCDSLDEARPQVVLAGMETHVCVLQTALELHATGHQVFVVEDAVSSRREDNRQNALARLRAAGVTVTNTESVLFEWLRNAGHEQFKTVSRLIR